QSAVARRTPGQDQGEIEGANVGRCCAGSGGWNPIRLGRLATHRCAGPEQVAPSTLATSVDPTEAGCAGGTTLGKASPAGQLFRARKLLRDVSDRFVISGALPSSQTGQVAEEQSRV